MNCMDVGDFCDELGKRLLVLHINGIGEDRSGIGQVVNSTMRKLERI